MDMEGIGKEEEEKGKEEKTILLNDLEHFIRHDSERARALSEHKNLVFNIATAIFRGRKIGVATKQISPMYEMKLTAANNANKSNSSVRDL